jgi:AcrR family transcriptional regulator
MAARERLTISELRARTGIPPATIHHYLRLGLLPSPHRDAPNRFTYDSRHVQALRLIRLLRSRRGLPLDAIRRVLPELAREGDQAFRPEMWDRVVGRRLAGAIRRAPAARLLEAAKEAFARRGYGEVGVDEICRSARMAKGSFYRHYRSKEELFLAAAASAADDVLRAWSRVAEPGPAGAASLSDHLEPRLPIFLDLLGRAIQRRPGYRAASRRILGRLAVEVGRRSGGADPARSGARILVRAIGRISARALEPSALDSLLAEA